MIDFKRSVATLAMVALFALTANAGGSYKSTSVDAPFEMPQVSEYVFPAKDFNIKKYGAKADGKTVNTKAIAKAIAACAKAGGGRVVVPAGTWVTGPIHLRSNVNLHLQEGAVLSFVDTPEAYLPAVKTTWEGIECYNYSPLVYAFECENVAISGKGTLKPKMDLWRTWFNRPDAHILASRQLYAMASTDVPVEQRQMAQGENNMRPQLIQFNRCKNVLLDGFKIRESPFWTIHLFMCENAIARGLDVYAHGHNNDGIDIEMTRNVLVENCSFDQGDDAVVIKSGRNRDAWRTDMPSENIVVRNCRIVHGHALLGIGSEMSGGVRNVYMHDCDAPASVLQVLQVKTNERRGGFIENIYMDNITTEDARRIVAIYTDVMYQWRKIVPTFETSITKIANINVQNIKAKNTDAIIELRGDARRPVKGVNIKNVSVERVNDFVSLVENVVDLNTDNITWKEYTPNDSPTFYDDVNYGKKESK